MVSRYSVSIGKARYFFFDGYEMHDVEGDFESFLLGQIAELEERKDKKVEKLKNRAGR